MNTISTYIRKDIADMAPYIPVPSIEDLSISWGLPKGKIIKLDSGENMYGYPPSVLKTLIKEAAYNYYPDPSYKKLRRALSDYICLPIENIIVGSGSDELLDLILRLILEPGQSVINCPPTFGMYAVYTKLNRGNIISIPRNVRDYSLDMKGIMEAITPDVQAIFICTPNNPTGTITPVDQIRSLLQTGKLIIVDEAYSEFGGVSAIPLVDEFDNLIVLRTFSKWAGLAGLRVGFAMMNPFLVTQLYKIKPPYNVNSAADMAAQAVLRSRSWQKTTINLVISERTRVVKELARFPFLTLYPTGANLVFMKYSGNMNLLKKFLEQKNIILRYFNSKETGQAIRMTIGTPQQNDAVLEAFRQFSSKLVNPDSVIFDMDGVLVDVSKSYRTAIKRTVGYFLKTEYKQDQCVTTDDINALKQVPGFNNDWDTSVELIRLLSRRVRRSEFISKARQVRSRKTRSYTRIKDIFQSFYLGSSLFSEIYQRPAPLNVKTGLITREIGLIDQAILTDLSRTYPMGIATSRPRREALYTLKKLGIMPAYIQEANIVALEDCPKEKPAPDPLILAKRRMNTIKPVYVGDSINDFIAAKNANIPCIFIGYLRNGDITLSNVNQIKELFL